MTPTGSEPLRVDSEPLRVDRLGDAELVLLARGRIDVTNSREAMAELWRRHFAAVYRSTWYQPFDPGIRTDIVTDAFLGALRSFPEKSRNSHLTFGFWWRQRCKWLGHKLRSRVSREVVAGELPEVPVLDEYPIETRVGIAQAFAKLNEKQRRVLLRIGLGYSVAEVSREEGVSPEAIRASMKRARERFRHLDRVASPDQSSPR